MVIFDLLDIDYMILSLHPLVSSQIQVIIIPDGLVKCLYVCVDQFKAIDDEGCQYNRGLSWKPSYYLNVNAAIVFLELQVKARPVPNWMHSQPLDPQSFKKDVEPVVIMSHKRSDCVLRVFAALVFGTSCGALGAFIVLCACPVIAAKKHVAPEECVAQPVVFDCDKVKVIVIDKW